MADCFAPLLARIDDRLIHGQVVVGCCEPLGGRSILLIDDEVASDGLQQKLYRAAAPPTIEVLFADVEGACELIARLASSGDLEGVVVVASRARTMVRLRDAGVEFAAVQLGGAHARDDTAEVSPGFFLDHEDRAALVSLIEAGTEVFIQPMASAASQPLLVSMLDGESS